MISVNVRFEMNINNLNARFDKRFFKANEWLDSEILKDCSPYIPFKTGQLERSGKVLKPGEITWNTPYARRLYYGTGFNFNKAYHPQATAQWFEKAKSVNLPKWVSGAEKVVTE